MNESELRTSDADREATAELLRRAHADGRIDTDELEQRLDACYGARTYGELDALVADLPRPRPRARPRPPLRPARLLAAVVAVVALAVAWHAAWLAWLVFALAFARRRRRCAV